MEPGEESKEGDEDGEGDGATDEEQEDHDVSVVLDDIPNATDNQKVAYDSSDEHKSREQFHDECGCCGCGEEAVQTDSALRV
jgi:hypothetical protein